MIMDGNRRWALRSGYNFTLHGHKKGIEALVQAVECCIANKIPYLSVYTFSIENFRRSDEEKGYLFDLLADSSDELLNTLRERNVSIRFVGDRVLIPDKVLPHIERLERETASSKETKLTLTSLFCYGGQQEVVAAAQSVARDVATGSLKPEQVTQELFESRLWTADLPAPELIVRTGGARRLSNFLLYRAAYSEIVCLDELWPDITHERLDKVIQDFSSIKRNFGH
jgi:undecaprenyl diphosphate synthase